MARGIEPVDRLVGHNIRIFRLDGRYSQESLANAIGVTFQQLQKYEKGTNRVGSSRLAKISEVLNVPIERFFEGSGSKANDHEHPAVLLTNAHALRLLKAFAKIRREDVRHSLVTLAEAFAGETTDDDKKESRRARRAAN